MPKHDKKPTTRRKAKKQVRKSGKKPVVISKRTIRKHGPGITKGTKVAFGKKRKPTQKGKVKRKIKFVAAVPRKPKPKRRKDGKRRKYKSRPLI